MKALVEDARDSTVNAEALASDDGWRCPAAVTRAIAAGATPPRAWRDHQGLALPDAAGLYKPYCIQIQGEKRARTARAH